MCISKAGSSKLEPVVASFKPPISSNSSIVGNCCVNSVTLPGLNWLRRGEDEADEDGEGGPKLDVGTNSRGVDMEMGGLRGDGDNGEICTVNREAIDDEGGSGGLDLGCGFGISLAAGFLGIETLSPALCNKAIRFAIDRGAEPLELGTQIRYRNDSTLGTHLGEAASRSFNLDSTVPVLAIMSLPCAYDVW